MVHVVRQVPQQAHAVLDQLGGRNAAHVRSDGRRGRGGRPGTRFYLVVHVFAVDLGLDDVHERVDQARALAQLPPGLAALRTHVPSEEERGEEKNTAGIRAGREEQPIKGKYLRGFGSFQRNYW